MLNLNRVLVIYNNASLLFSTLLIK